MTQPTRYLSAFSNAISGGGSHSWKVEDTFKSVFSTIGLLLKVRNLLESDVTGDEEERFKKCTSDVVGKGVAEEVCQDCGLGTGYMAKCSLGMKQRELHLTYRLEGTSRSSI